MSDKTYVGKGKTFGKFGQVKIGFRYTDVTPNEKGFVNLVVAEMKAPDKWGNTHTVYIDDWKPEGKKQEDAPF